MKVYEKDKSGQMLVEAVIILPIVLMILFSSLDFGRAFIRQIELNFLAYNAARIMMVHQPDTAIVRQHIEAYSSLYRNLNRNEDKIKSTIIHDDSSDAYVLSIEYSVQRSVSLVPWDTLLVRRGVAPFIMGDPNPRDIPYKWNRHTNINGEPAIEGYDHVFRKGLARREGVVTSLSGNSLSSFLMKQWYPEKVNVGGVSFLEAAKLNWWGLIWWYGYLDPDTRDAIDAYMMFGLTPVGYGNDEWLTRKYTGFMHGKDRFTYWGMATSPPPPIYWDEGPDCATGNGGFYYANSWTARPFDVWSRDDGAMYWAESHEVCTEPIEGPWGCIWCAHSEFTPVTHYVMAHAGGGMWNSNTRNNWNFYNAIWTLALLPESYATATYYSNYWNIKDDMLHTEWQNSEPSYKPNEVSGFSAAFAGFGSNNNMDKYAGFIPQGNPADEQRTLWMSGSDESR